MSVSSFVSREVKFAEAAVIAMAANSINSKSEAIEVKIEVAIPQGVAAVVSAVEKVDGSVIGPAEAAFVNGTLNAYSAEVDAELAKLLVAGEALVPKVVTALLNVAAKLQVEALASK